MSPEYDSSRNWIESQKPKDKTPAAERLFISYIDYAADHLTVRTNGTTILRFHKGITLRDVIDATPLRGKKVGVYILRPSEKTKAAFDQKVEPSAEPAFEVRPLDLLFLFGPSPIPRW